MIPSLLNRKLPFCSLINISLLQFNTMRFVNDIVLPLLVCKRFVFIPSEIASHFKEYRTGVLYI